MKKLESFIATGWVYQTYYAEGNLTYPSSINLNYDDTSGLYFPYSSSCFKFENKITGLQLKIKNDSILIDPVSGIYVNENSHGFLGPSLITNSNTLVINDDSLEINTSGLYNMSFYDKEFKYNELDEQIELSDNIKKILDKAENMPTYLSPTNEDIYIFVDENYQSNVLKKGDQINIFDPDNVFGKMTLNGTNNTYSLSGLSGVTESDFTSVASDFFGQLNTQIYNRQTVPIYRLLPDDGNDNTFYDSTACSGLFQLAWLIVLNECCLHKLTSFYICNDLTFAIDLCRTFSTTAKLNYNIILMSEIDYFKHYQEDKGDSDSVRQWEIPAAKAGGNTVQIYSCVEFVRRMFYFPKTKLHTIIYDKIDKHKNDYFTVKQMKHTAFVLQDYISQIYPDAQVYLMLYSNIAFYGVWFVEAVRKDRVLHYLEYDTDGVTPKLLSSCYGYR